MGKTKQAPPQRMFVATESFSTEVEGVPQSIVKDDTRVWEGHELVQKFPFWFREIEAHYGMKVEAATAAPGEERE